MIPTLSASLLAADCEFLNELAVARGFFGTRYISAVVQMHAPRVFGRSITASEALRLAKETDSFDLQPINVFHPAGAIPPGQPTPKKEIPVKFIEKKTLINGTDVKDLTNDQLLSIISQKTIELKKYKDLGDAIPARLKKHVAAIEKDLADLTATLDEADAKADTAKAAAPAAPAA